MEAILGQSVRSREAAGQKDFLLLTPSLVPRLAAAGVDAEHCGREKPSDHAPIWIRLKTSLIE